LQLIAGWGDGQPKFEAGLARRDVALSRRSVSTVIERTALERAWTWKHRSLSRRRAERQPIITITEAFQVVLLVDDQDSAKEFSTTRIDLNSSRAGKFGDER
jgi:hypothetical protein